MNKKINYLVGGVVLVIVAFWFVGSLFNKNPDTSLVKGTSVDATRVADNSSPRYSMDEVGSHKDTSGCWSVVNEKVYDLTDWINQHPGGPGNILSICGTDGSAAFNAQHGGQIRPKGELDSFFIGNLLSN